LAVVTAEVEEISMDSHAVEAAYVPFVTELRNGGFADPVQGWAAELVAAHIACSNTDIAAVAELAAAGQQPSFDTLAAVDDEQLRRSRQLSSAVTTSCW
jgi:hypothetical protein